MNDTLVYGSLVLSATTPVLPFPIFEHASTLSGTHTESRTRGLYSTLVSDPSLIEATVALPQRNKYMQTSVLSENEVESNRISGRLCSSLSDLDSRFEGARHLYKLQTLLNELAEYDSEIEFLAIINNTSEHASFSILSHGVAIDLIGVYDVVNRSVRLVWTIDDHFVTDLKAIDQTRYLFYRFPIVYDRPLFIYTQSVCAKWYSWSKTFTDTDGVFKAFNALENFLFKNPNLPELDRF
jgi:hypothetical protein